MIPFPLVAVCVFISLGPLVRPELPPLPSSPPFDFSQVMTPGPQRPKDDKEKAQLKALEGYWKVEAVELQGKPRDPSKGWWKVVRFRGDRVGILESGAKGWKHGGYIEINTTTTPPSCRFILNEHHWTGADGRQGIGFVFFNYRGVYQVDGETLKICVVDDMSFDPTPSSLSTSPCAAGMLITLRREKR